MISCTAVLHHCLECNKVFLPDRYKKAAKHFHALKSWAMYQHVVHRLSFQQLESIFKDTFNLNVAFREIHAFKYLLSQYYRTTYSKSFHYILSGNIIHADETHINFQKGKGYVWVLANMENVIYVYRPTQGRELASRFTRDFKGVLITDFYSAYDSIDCEQQKCLVHLIRDMNDDLRSNPSTKSSSWWFHCSGRFCGALLALSISMVLSKTSA